MSYGITLYLTYNQRHRLSIALPLPTPSTSLLLVVGNIFTEHCFLIYPLYYCDYQVAVFVPLVPSHFIDISVDSQSTLSCLAYYRHFEIH
jgi:hypothetical protein